MKGRKTPLAGKVVALAMSAVLVFGYGGVLSSFGAANAQGQTGAATGSVSALSAVDAQDVLQTADELPEADTQAQGAASSDASESTGSSQQGAAGDANSAKTGADDPAADGAGGADAAGVADNDAASDALTDQVDAQGVSQDNAASASSKRSAAKRSGLRALGEGDGEGEGQGGEDADGPKPLDDYISGVSFEVSSDEGKTWTAYKSGMKIDYGDRVRVVVSWRFPNTGFSVKNGDTFTYALPGDIKYYENKGDLHNGARTDGTFQIKDKTLTIAYSRDMASNVRGHVTFYGEILEGEGDTTAGGQKEIAFPGTDSFTVDINPVHELKLMKTYEDKTPHEEGHDDAANGKFDFTIAIASRGVNTNIEIKDSMGGLLSLDDPQDGIKLYADKERTQEIESGWSVVCDEATDPLGSGASLVHGFTVNIDRMEDDTYYLCYLVNGDKDAIYDARQDKKTSLYRNSASYHSDETAEGKDPKVDRDVMVNQSWDVNKTGKVATGGDGKADLDNPLITWSVVIDPGEGESVEDAKVVDKPGSGLETPSNYSLYSSNDGGESWQEISKDNSWTPVYAEGENGTEDTSQIVGYTFTLPSNLTDDKLIYKIVYTTGYKVGENGVPTDHEGGKIFYNAVEITPKGHHYPIDDTGSAPVGTNDHWAHVDKTAIGAPDGETENEFKPWWLIKVTVEKDITGATLVDKPRIPAHTNYTLVNPQDVKIFTDEDMTQEFSQDYYDFSTTDDASLFRIDFKKPATSDPSKFVLEAGTTLYIRYRADVVSTGASSSFTPTIWNDVELKYIEGNGTRSASDSYTMHTHMRKSLLSLENGIFTWALIVDKLSDAKDISINDTLPANHSLVAGSVKAYASGKATGGDQVSGVSVKENGQTENGKTLTFTVAKNALASANSAGVRIEYQTTYTDIKAIPEGKTGYVNRARIVVDGAQEPETIDYTDKDQPKIVTKTGTYTAATAPLVNYRIKVNDDGLKLNDGKTLVLTDTMGSALELVAGSVKVVDANGDEPKGWSYGYEPSTKTMTLKLPDMTALTVSYQARMLLAPDESDDALSADNATNTAVLKGYEDFKGQTSHTVVGKVIEAEGVSEDDAYTLLIHKATAAGATDHLAGARFTVDELDVERGGKAWSSTGVASTKESTTTGDDGFTGQINAFKADTIYRVSESVVPTGFKAVDPLYLVFPGDDAASFDNYEGVTIDGAPLTVAALNGAAMSFYTWWATDADSDETVALKIAKRWDDQENIDGSRPTSVAVQVYADGEPYGDAVSVSGDADASTWEYTVEGLPKYRFGKELVYTVDEVDVPSGYTKSSVDGDAASGITITNSHKPELVELVVDKKWKDGANADGIRPDAVTVHVFGDGKDTGASAVLNAQNDWHAVLSGLPKTYAGKEVAYTVVEDVPDGYKSEVTGTAKDGFTVVNTHDWTRPDDGRVDLPVEKLWDDDHDIDARPESVVVRLYANGMDTGRWVVLKAEEGWTGKFTNLPAETVGGNSVEYTMQEGRVKYYSSDPEFTEQENWEVVNSTDVTQIEEDPVPLSSNPDGSDLVIEDEDTPTVGDDSGSDSSSGKSGSSSATDTGDEGIGMLSLLMLVALAAGSACTTAARFTRRARR